MRTYTKAGLVGLALLSSAEVRNSGTQSPTYPCLRVCKTPEGWSPRPHAPLFAVPPRETDAKGVWRPQPLTPMCLHRAWAGIFDAEQLACGCACMLRAARSWALRVCAVMVFSGFLRGACLRRDADACLVCRPFLSDRQRFPSTGVPVSWHARQRPLCAQPRSDDRFRSGLARQSRACPLRTSSMPPAAPTQSRPNIRV